MKTKGAFLSSLAASFLAAVSLPALAAEPAKPTRYYGHEAVLDRHGVIAPWYHGLNGPCDLRVRIAAETLKRFPWTTTRDAVAVYPHYVFTGWWQIATNGTISSKTTTDWANGDLGQRATSVLNGFVDYYRYTGDPAAIAHVTYMADYLLDHCLTPPDHPWPGLFISVPTKGKTYAKCDPSGMIQLDICGSTGEALLRAYQLTGNERWLAAVKHWGDLLAARCNRDPNNDPWPRYANPEAAKWNTSTANKQTGGVAMILSFLDELIRLGYTGKDNAIVTARDAGRRYLRERLLPAWFVNDTWGRYFWDWENPVQNCCATPDAARYLLNHKAEFPNWSLDARNILTLFFNRSSVSPASNGDVYSGAWAYPEANNCCGRSLWYAPLVLAPTLAQLAAETGDDWCRELALRQMVLQTYDIHETGVTEDNMDGGTIVNGNWLNIAHPLPLRFVLAAVAWLPAELGASRENHIVRSTAVVNSVTYGDGRIEYSTFDAPPDTVEVLRLAFVPARVTADGRSLEPRRDLDCNGYAVQRLPNGDAIVTVRHDGARKVVVTGNDPQRVMDAASLAREGEWKEAGGALVAETPGTAIVAKFNGNQVRLIGGVEPAGGLADVYLDGEKQLVHVDCWSSSPRDRQVLYYRNGLAQGPHTLKIVARGAGNPYSKGNRIRINAVQFSEASVPFGFPTGGGSKDAQRVILGYASRTDYVDSRGHSWRPATELVTRLGAGTDSVAQAWWITPQANAIANTPDPTLYRHGVHARDFTVYFTVGPGTYHARIKLVETRDVEPPRRAMTIAINGREMVANMDIAATAGGLRRAADLMFNDIAPKNGIIAIRFKGPRRGEAAAQAIEIAPGSGGKGATPVCVPPDQLDELGEMLVNPAFEDGVKGATGKDGATVTGMGWNYVFLTKTRSIVWGDSGFNIHPQWGPPKPHTGREALRSHGDDGAHTLVYQDVEVSPHATYRASVWVRAADLHGKGFGKHPNDSAGLRIEERDASGNVLVKHPKVAVTKAGDYVELAREFSTTDKTTVVRFILDTVMACGYQEGHVAYDDCSLEKWKTRP